MATTPDSISYPSQPYGLLGPYPWQTVNVQDFGATGDGVTDDGPRFQLALDALAGGGILIIPPAPSGTYLIGQCLRHPSYLIVRGSGAAAVLKASAVFTEASDYGGTAIFLNENAGPVESSFSGYRDFQITFESVWFDNSLRLDGDAHAIFHRATKTVSIINCRFIDGGDATAAVTCDDHVVDGCTAIGQTNCTYDHWGGATNCRVVNSYGEVGATSTGQLVNFNGILTSLDGGIDDVWHSDGFVVSNCDLICSAHQRSLSLEPLGANATVKNVRIVGNRFRNTRIVMSNNTTGIVISSNIFSDSDGTSSTIWARAQFGVDGAIITISGNEFRDCDAPTDSGLIDSSADDTSIIGNTAVGGTYEYAARFRSIPARGVYIGNTMPDATISETLGVFGIGSNLYARQEEEIGWRAASGAPAVMTVDGTNTLYLLGVALGGGPRSLFSCTMDSSISSFIVYPNLLAAAFFRQSIGTPLTATGTTRLDAYEIAHSGNEFTTVAAGTGCILPSDISGGSIVIWNFGANTLNVYPVAGNQIDALGTNNPDTIAAGSSKRYTAMTNAFYRTAP